MRSAVSLSKARQAEIRSVSIPAQPAGLPSISISDFAIVTVANSADAAEKCPQYQPSPLCR